MSRKFICDSSQLDVKPSSSSMRDLTDGCSRLQKNCPTKWLRSSLNSRLSHHISIHYLLVTYLKLSFNSRELLVGSFPCSLKIWCRLGVNVVVWTMNTLYQFIEGQTHLWDPKRCLALNVPKQVALQSNSSMHHNWKGVLWICMSKTRWKIIGTNSQCKTILTLILYRTTIKIHLRTFAATKCITYLQHDGPRLEGNQRWLMNYQSQETFVHLPLSANDSTINSGLNGRISA